MSSTRGRVIPAQMKKLLDLLSEDGVLLHGKVMYTYTTKQCFWKRIATQLNSVDGGVYKNTWKWCKMWTDWKTKTKKKANILLKRKQYDCEQPVSALTNLELRLLKLIEYPVDDLPEHQQFGVTVSKEYLSDNADPEVECMIFNEEENGDQDLEDESSQQGHTNRNETQFYSVNMPNVADNSKEKFEDSSGSDTNSKSERFFTRRIRLQDLKKVMPKDKVQKSEELRLKALELKLKGEELRLKEMEMNKINYLTNIEEEKLKCFRDISTSLKELVEHARNGNIRFNNAV
ncbi:uncharacterized protein LOC135077994 isoform X1 [Ostrinia nubilalis]|uniref:uncharacterized protein LOC135077994 isoform X1 n=1 Tax=Ostrinia nubilalis TaxID=29057 RepID=UPI0030825639